MNKWRISLNILLIAMFMGCASTKDKAEGLSLMGAIEESAQKIASELPAKSRVVIVAFESENPALSDYIMEELTGALFDRSIEIADRKNLDYVYKELNFQMSGDVNDETALSIGKFLGAQMVITGDFVDQGGSYRLRTSAINAETALRASVPRLDVKKNPELTKLIKSMAGGKTEEITSKYGVSEQTLPQTAGTFLDRGIMFASRSEYDEAIADFSEALKINPNLAAAYLLRGRALFASVSYVKSVSGNFAGVEAISTWQGPSLGKAEALDRAIADFTRALSMDPNNAQIYLERGQILIEKQDYDRAILDFNQSIQLNPSYWAYNNRGLAYNNKGQYNTAIPDFDQALKIYPSGAVAYLNRGNSYLDSNNPDRAIADYNMAIQLDPNYMLAYHNRALAYLRKNDYDNAIAGFTRSLQMDPNFLDAYNNRGYSYYRKGDYDAAIADFETLLRIDPNHSYARVNLDNARRERGW